MLSLQGSHPEVLLRFPLSNLSELTIREYWKLCFSQSVFSGGLLAKLGLKELYYCILHCAHMVRFPKALLCSWGNKKIRLSCHFTSAVYTELHRGQEVRRSMAAQKYNQVVGNSFSYGTKTLSQPLKMPRFLIHKSLRKLSYSDIPAWELWIKLDLGQSKTDKR